MTTRMHEATVRVMDGLEALTKEGRRALSACRSRRHSVDDMDDRDTNNGDGTTVIIPGSDTQPGWDQIAPPSDPDYTTGGEDNG